MHSIARSTIQSHGIASSVQYMCSCSVRRCIPGTSRALYTIYTAMSTTEGQETVETSLIHPGKAQSCTMCAVNHVMHVSRVSSTPAYYTVHLLECSGNHG